VEVMNQQRKKVERGKVGVEIPISVQFRKRLASTTCAVLLIDGRAQIWPRQSRD